MKQPLSRIDDIPNKGSILVDFFGRSAHVFKLKGVTRALMNTCMHIGGALEYQNGEGEGKFVCQWHNAEFAADGHCIKGPAPSNSKLMFIPTRIEDGVLYYVWGE